MKPYQQRVIDEKRELDNKLSKLNAFIVHSTDFCELSVLDQQLLMRQAEAMTTYNEVLQLRINEFDESEAMSGRVVSVLNTQHAGNVAPSTTHYVVTNPHKHKMLKLGDVVVMVETPTRDNLLLRVADVTLHSLMDDADQYVHLTVEQHSEWD